MADTLAKEAAGKHDVDPSSLADRTLALEEYVELVTGAGRVLASWRPSRVKWTNRQKECTRGHRSRVPYIAMRS